MVTPAVLRNNRTMETLPNEEPPRKRQCRSRVRFSEEKNQTRVFDNFAEMTETDRTAVRQQLWYTSEEFDSFLEDRLQTIRMWRAVGGNTRLIEPHYVVRGLEMYETAKLNGDVLTARAAHIQAVLQEQSRQRLDNGGALDWNALASAVTPRSAWAMRQASRLALKDSLEVQDDFETDASGLALTDDVVNMSLKRLSMPFSSEQIRAPRRMSLPCTTPYNSASASTRAPVDVFKLKEMNRQFLKSMTTKQFQDHKNGNKMPMGAGASHSNSLAHMLVRGRRMALQNNAQAQQGNDMTMGCGIRRDSLKGLLQGATSDDL